MSAYENNKNNETAMESAEATPVTIRPIKKGTICNAHFVKIHEGPDLYSKTIGVRKNGHRLAIKKRVGDMYMIEFDGFPGGYVSDKYFKEDPS